MNHAKFSNSCPSRGALGVEQPIDALAALHGMPQRSLPQRLHNLAGYIASHPHGPSHHQPPQRQPASPRGRSCGLMMCHRFMERRMWSTEHFGSSCWGVGRFECLNRIAVKIKNKCFDSTPSIMTKKRNLPSLNFFSGPGNIRPVLRLAAPCCVSCG